MDVARLVVAMRKCSIEYIQSMFSVEFKRAYHIMCQLQKQGIIGKEKSRDILIDEKSLKHIYSILKDWLS